MAIRVQDDRGAWGELVNTGSFVLETSEGSRLPAVLRQRVASKMERELTARPPWKMAAWVIVPIIVLVGPAHSIYTSFFLGAGAPPQVASVILGALPHLVAVGITVITVIFGARMLSGRQRRSIAKLLVAEAYCPGCLYHLAELPVQADRCWVCPECGAAWRAPKKYRASNPPEGA